MKRLFKILLVLLILLIVFRQPIYKATVNYTKVGERENIRIVDENLIDLIDNEIGDKSIDIEEVVRIAKYITNESFNFTTENVSKDPNLLINTSKANCVGYSGMFNSIANYIIRQKNLENTFVAKHLIGKLSFLGFNVHSLFKNSFLKNHDYNQVINIKTGDTIYIDPSLSDYFKIHRVNCKN